VPKKTTSPCHAPGMGVFVADTATFAWQLVMLPTNFMKVDTEPHVKSGGAGFRLSRWLAQLTMPNGIVWLLFSLFVALTKLTLTWLAVVAAAATCASLSGGRENGVWLKANKIFTHFPFHILSGRVEVCGQR